MVYTYDYSEYSHWWQFSWYASFQDSGIVEYIIEDSSIVADTLVAWSVLQKRSLLHRAHYSGGADTSYFFRDSSLFTLNESRTGQHELTGGLGEVWAFPIGQALHVFRYSDSTQVQLGWRGSGNCHVIPGTYDTLSMSVDSSLWRRHYGVCIDWDDYGNLFQRRARLRSLVIVSVPDIQHLPKAVRLNQNYPNPFNPSTTITFQLPSQSHVMLRVFDVLGREVAALVDRVKSAGQHEITWDASNRASGMYFYRLSAGGVVQTKKLLLLR
jgi:hypothetical protein